MKIFFVRHAEAENTHPDDSREITQRGKIKLLSTINTWRKLNSDIDYVITSPLVRAKQTAEIIHEKFDVKNEMLFDKSLLNGSSLEELIISLKSLDGENFVLVMHQPQVSTYCSMLLSCSGSSIAFSPGSVGCVKLTAAGPYLEFFLPPH
ncbi:MAG: histidine phosphatase family protein [Melioribacteraceae bacterium]|nr:histidine phosphatase family protein [Melioribacteraceae bacterium]MCF8354625.1 histidine phosphatase family protein [Melioribacteraceae bacterium]MCF8395013.1 histidine phosphatase family protein [Melioribacteraceae bacterium]